MTFVQITFGSTINRQLRNIVSWVTSDLMVHQYVQHFRSTFWHGEDQTIYNDMPYGSDINISNSHPAPVEGKCNRTDKDKLATRREIEAALFPQSTTSPEGCLPEVLVNVVGQQAARNGAMKVFEVLQDAMLNKVLAYEILEIVCKVLFPELAQEYKQQ